MQPAEKISITLPPDMVRLIRDKVASGAYASTSEVIRDAMRVWQRHEEEHAERIAAIRARLQRSMDDPRPDIPAEEVRAWIDELKAAAKKNGGR
ncbi:MAG TPA: type II toxin-antitoxin system ParD family antitoxin [Vineibacter sp.]|nr:type II toxin-antitoxin system ParD family antitoxin [Vineibacter sp.]